MWRTSLRRVLCTPLLNTSSLLLRCTQLTLRHSILPKHVRLREWPPKGTLVQAMEEWSTSDVLVAPHGAGTTNVIFMPADSAVIEIIAAGQKGRVYGSLALAMGHRHSYCTYVRNGLGSRNVTSATQAHEGMRSGYFNSFALDMEFFLDCFKRSGVVWSVPPGQAKPKAKPKAKLKAKPEVSSVTGRAKSAIRSIFQRWKTPSQATKLGVRAVQPK